MTIKTSATSGVQAPQGFWDHYPKTTVRELFLTVDGLKAKLADAKSKEAVLEMSGTTRPCFYLLLEQSQKIGGLNVKSAFKVEKFHGKVPAEAPHPRCPGPTWYKISVRSTAKEFATFSDAGKVQNMIGTPKTALAFTLVARPMRYYLATAPVTKS